MSKPDNSPAFPLPHTGNELRRDGMSLRDYFAVEYAAAWIIALCARWDESGYSDMGVINEANRLGLLQADAMLKERGR